MRADANAAERGWTIVDGFGRIRDSQALGSSPAFDLAPITARYYHPHHLLTSAIHPTPVFHRTQVPCPPLRRVHSWWNSRLLCAHSAVQFVAYDGTPSMLRKATSGHQDRECVIRNQ